MQGNMAGNKAQEDKKVGDPAEYEQSFIDHNGKSAIGEYTKIKGQGNKPPAEDQL